MTKEEVVSLWGKTDLITFKTADGKTFETWEYHFSVVTLYHIDNYAL
jgi:hypothetical protein